MMRFEKQSSLTAAALVHVAQNLAMKKALKSKAFAQHVADGFRHGLHGVVDASRRGRAIEFASGAFLPEIHTAYSEAHHLGRKVVEAVPPKHLDTARKLAESGKLGEAPFLPGHLREPVKAVEKHIHGNLGTHFGRPGEKLVPGHPDAKRQVLGGLATAVLDPWTGAVNTGKNLLNSPTLDKLYLFHKAKEYAKNRIVVNPAKHALVSPGEVSGAKDALKETLISPVPVFIKRTISKHTTPEIAAIYKNPDSAKGVILKKINEKYGDQIREKAFDTAKGVATAKVKKTLSEKLLEHLRKPTTAKPGPNP